MNPTEQLLGMIPSPFAKNKFEENRNRRELESAYVCAVKNKMALLFLGKLIERQPLSIWRQIYQNELARYKETLTTIAATSSLLSKGKIEHAIFKTVRPYDSATVDIDIIIFGNHSDYVKSVRLLERAGYSYLGNGPQSTTLWDKSVKIGIDLYNEIAVSHVVYMDKNTLRQNIVNHTLESGDEIRMLNPEADLACIIAHSVIKEQMYTLSEYYSFVNYLKRIDAERFLKLVKLNNVSSAVSCHASLTAFLHQTHHGPVPQTLQMILSELGQNTLEPERLNEKDFSTPHKYHLLTFARSLLEIAKSSKTRKSIAHQAFKLSDPRSSKQFSRLVMEHILRETY
jgi:hypothetical protein